MLKQQTKTETEAKTTVGEAQKNTPGTLILQWLTYAFWGWTILALAYLTGVSVSFMLEPAQMRSGDSDMVSYSLAAVIVLFVISLVCDVLYVRREPQRKTGAATVIMIVHAVIFALCGIAALIVAVFAVVNMIINTVGTGNQTALYTGLIIAVVYAAAFIRTVGSLQLMKTSYIYWAFMSIIVITIATLGILGPAAHGRATKSDRMIESGLPLVSEQINSYASENGALPKSLDDIKTSLRGDAAEIVVNGQVEYTPGDRLQSHDINRKTLNDSRQAYLMASEPSFAYDLCVEYVGEARDRYSGGGEPYGERQNTPNVYEHDKGRVCYKLQTSGVY